MANALSAHFVKRFGGAAIEGDLEIPMHAQRVTVLFGPSGCGKTTVLRCLAGLEVPDEGTIRFGTETWLDTQRDVCLTPQQRGIGFVFQHYALFPHLSVAANVAYGLHDLNAPERKRRVSDLLAQFELTDQADRRPHQLSGGQQQRVALARTLACRPRLLLLDEPLAALDAALREQLRVELRHYLVASATPVLLVTHDREEALVLGDELVVMSNGTVRQSGPVLDVFTRPADAEVARIVRVENLQPGRILQVIDGLATVEVGATRLVGLSEAGSIADVWVSIRGEEVILQRSTGAASSVRNALQARVVAVHAGSPLNRVQLDAGFPLFAFVTRPACEELELRPGADVMALIKAPAVHLIPRGQGD